MAKNMDFKSSSRFCKFRLDIGKCHTLTDSVSVGSAGGNADYILPDGASGFKTVSLPRQSESAVSTET